MRRGRPAGSTYGKWRNPFEGMVFDPVFFESPLAQRIWIVLLGTVDSYGRSTVSTSFLETMSGSGSSGARRSFEGFEDAFVALKAAKGIVGDGTWFDYEGRRATYAITGFDKILDSFGSPLARSRRPRTG